MKAILRVAAFMPADFAMLALVVLASLRRCVW
jgi:hypothetical protein